MSAAGRNSQSARALIISSGLAAREAELLLLGLLNKDRAWLYARGDEALAPSVAEAYQGLVERRRAGEPVAYILGQREFWSLPLLVGPGVLIPRPDTELLVEWALELAGLVTADCCLDLGTGSGAIALALKKELPAMRVTAVDVSPDALAIARANGRNLGLEVEWLESDWFAALESRRWPLIVSNPPYIGTDDPHLAQGDLPHEPSGALASGNDGLDAIRCIIEGAPAHLRPEGWLCFEHGWNQGGMVRSLLQRAGFSAVQSRRDLAGHERVTGGRL